MQVMVLGGDGYTGWPAVCHLLEHGHDVTVVDDCGKRKRTESVTPIASLDARREAATEAFVGRSLGTVRMDVARQDALRSILWEFDPDAIVNLAQIPAAPYSMQSLDAAWETIENNVRGSLNLYWALHDLGLDAHVVQLATMGEYGTPDATIPEGFLPDGRPAPKNPGSLYHASKVATTANTLFLARTWGIPTTEIYQGIVVGLNPYAERDDRLETRLDVDATWGTVANRFAAQAVAGEPLTVYGSGEQTRAMLSLADCIDALRLAVEQPPGAGEGVYRPVNQFTATRSVLDIARTVQGATGADIRHLPNPRDEREDHRYDVERGALDRLGFESRQSVDDAIRETIDRVERHADRIPTEQLRPETEWS